MKRPGTPSLSAPPPGWRFKVGAGLFVLGLICPLFVPLVAASDLEPTLKAVVSGGLMLGIPEVLWLVAAAIMGKQGFVYLKSRAWGLLKKAAPPDQVGRPRYALGLVLFSIPLFVGWIAPYVSEFSSTLSQNRILIGVVGDVMLLVSLWLLGGDFWDKLRALYLPSARMSLPEKGQA